MTKEETNDLLSAIKEDLESKQSKRKTWSPPPNQEGDFKIRILPPLKRKGERLFYSFYKVHWINKTPYLCLNQRLTDKNGNTHEPEDCPICNHVRKLYKLAGTDKESDEYKLAGSISARDRYVYRVVVRGSEDETQPVLWEASKTMNGAIVSFMTSDNPDKNYGIIVDPLQGRDFILTKTGKGQRSNYDQSVPSKNEGPIFTDKEKIQKVLINAEKLDYSSLYEFSSKELLSKSLREYLSGDEEQVEKKTEEKRSETRIEKNEVIETKDEDGGEDDAIDDLLKDLF